MPVVHSHMKRLWTTGIFVSLNPYRRRVWNWIFGCKVKSKLNKRERFSSTVCGVPQLHVFPRSKSSNQRGRPGGRRANNGSGPDGTRPASSSEQSQQQPGDGSQRNFTRPSTTLPPGVSEDQFNKAQAACRDKLPQRPNANGGQGQRAGAYLSCLKDNGVAVDPTAGMQQLDKLDKSSQTYQSAQTKCSALTPQGGNGRVAPQQTTSTSTNS